MSDLVKIHKKRLWVLCCHKKKEITYYAILWQPVTACDRKKSKLSRPKPLKTQGVLGFGDNVTEKKYSLHGKNFCTCLYILYIYKEYWKKLSHCHGTAESLDFQWFAQCVTLSRHCHRLSQKRENCHRVTVTDGKRSCKSDMTAHLQ